MSGGEDPGHGPEVRVVRSDRAPQETSEPLEPLAIGHRPQLDQGQGASVREQEEGADEAVADGDRAVAAWVAYATDGGDEASRDAAWAWAEEQSVRYGEAIADDAGLSFGPSLEAFVRFSHVYRAAVDRHEETALLAAITGSLDLGGLARLAADVRDVLVRRIDDLIDLPFEPLVDWLRRWPLPIDPPLPFDPLDPLGLVDLPDPLDLVAGGADRILDWVAGAPPVEVVIGALTRAVTPDAVAAWGLDPAATPPAMIASVLDDVLGVQPPMPEPPASYYVGMLVDRGYLRGLPTVLPEAPGAVPRLPGE